MADLAQSKKKRHGENRVSFRGVGGSRTRDGGFAIKNLPVIFEFHQEFNPSGPV